MRFIFTNTSKVAEIQAKKRISKELSFGALVTDEYIKLSITAEHTVRGIITKDVAL